MKVLSQLGLIIKYVNETGCKIENEKDLENVKQRFPREFALAEKEDDLRKKLWRKLSKDFRRNRGINEYTTSELKSLNN